MDPSRTDQRPRVTAAELPAEDSSDSCDICGSERVVWQKCKLICLNCGTILKSCADL